MRIVIDTSVVVAAVRSRSGASFALIHSIPSRRFEICLSVGLYTEWRDVLGRAEHLPSRATTDDVDGLLRELLSHAHLQAIFFLWRPFLLDPGDDMVVELALAAGAHYIVTHNIGDFAGATQLGVTVVTPSEFLGIVSRKP